jgi:formate hydrogenlyase subunit 6/NADH:ubiquinone oxidoreductase subunit I
MAKIAIRNLFTKPATRRYPFAVREPFPGSRGRVVIDFPTCIHCGACGRRCPAAAITVDRADKSWKIDHFACVQCGLCVRVCPKASLSLGPERRAVALAADLAGRTEAHRAEGADA